MYKKKKTCEYISKDIWFYVIFYYLKDLEILVLSILTKDFNMYFYPKINKSNIICIFNNLYKKYLCISSIYYSYNNNDKYMKEIKHSLILSAKKGYFSKRIEYKIQKQVPIEYKLGMYFFFPNYPIISWKILSPTFNYEPFKYMIHLKGITLKYRKNIIITNKTIKKLNKMVLREELKGNNIINIIIHHFKNNNYKCINNNLFADIEYFPSNIYILNMIEFCINWHYTLDKYIWFNTYVKNNFGEINIQIKKSEDKRLKIKTEYIIFIKWKKNNILSIL